MKRSLVEGCLKRGNSFIEYWPDNMVFSGAVIGNKSMKGQAMEYFPDGRVWSRKVKGR